MNKLIIIGSFIFLLLPTLVFSQAGSSSEFKLKIKFDQEIPVPEIQPYYCLHIGNHMDKIVFETDTVENSITISGKNSYIVLVSFPMLIFSHTQITTLQHNNEKVEKTNLYYLVSQTPITTYTGEQTKEIKFSSLNPVIKATMKLSNKLDSFADINIENSSLLSPRDAFIIEIPTCNEMIKINKK